MVKSNSLNQSPCEERFLTSLVPAAMAMPSSTDPVARSIWASAAQTPGAATPRSRAQTPSAATPIPGQPHPAPSGMTPPPAKRPMDRESIQIAMSGQRSMTHEELSGAFYNLLGRLEREEQFTQQMRDAVIGNAEILDNVYKQTVKHQLDIGIMVAKSDSHEQMVNQIAVELRDNIGQAIIDVDKKLRDELDQVVVVIEKKFTAQQETLQQLINQVTPGAASAGPGQTGDGKIATLEQQTEILKSVVNETRELVVASNASIQASVVHAQELAQRAISATETIAVEVGRLSSLAGSAGTAGTAASGGAAGASTGEGAADPFDEALAWRAARILNELYFQADEVLIRHLFREHRLRVFALLLVVV